MNDAGIRNCLARSCIVPDATVNGCRCMHVVLWENRRITAVLPAIWIHVIEAERYQEQFISVRTSRLTKAAVYLNSKSMMNEGLMRQVMCASTVEWMEECYDIQKGGGKAIFSSDPRGTIQVRARTCV